MQTTLGLIPEAFVDDVLREGLLFLVSLTTRGAIKVLLLRLIMVVAIGYFSASTSSLHPRAV
jgi:hypothetical protein